MHFSTTVVALFAASVSAHGVITQIKGANGVTMPGLTIADGTPRDCTSNRCGSQADTAIIRDRDISSGKATPLGRTQGNGPVNAAVMVGNFVGNGNAAPGRNNGAASGVGQEDNIQQRRQLFGGRLGKNRGGAGRTGAGGAGGLGAAGAAGAAGGAGAGGLAALLGGGAGGAAGGAGVKSSLPTESRVASTRGQGATKGLPTASDDGVVTMTLRQINQDGAGPFTADVDGTSGGTRESAMQPATVVKNVPGIGFGGLSAATNTDFEMQVKIPAGMTCDATVAGVNNVCVMRVRNNALAGPFGGSVAFTQSKTSRKRAIAYRLKKRMEIGRN